MPVDLRVAELMLGLQREPLLASPPRILDVRERERARLFCAMTARRRVPSVDPHATHEPIAAHTHVAIRRAQLVGQLGHGSRFFVASSMRGVVVPRGWMRLTTSASLLTGRISSVPS